MTKQQTRSHRAEMGEKFVFVTCPLCHADEAAQVFELQDWSEWGYGGSETFSLVSCQVCGLYYLNPRPSSAHMGTYYPSHYTAYNRKAIEDEPWALMRYMRRRKMIRRRTVIQRACGLDKGHILDVGCATGIFLAEMKRSGWSVHGVEFNAEAADYARRRFEITVDEGDLLTVALQLNSFDAITMWDVLEHTFEPLAILQKIYTLLRPGGIVACTVPNLDSLDRHLFGASWVGYDPPRHLTVFSTGVLCRMLEQAGFQVLSLRCDFGGYWPFAGSLNTWINRHIPSARLRRALIGLMNIPGMRLPFEPFFKLLDRLNLGNELLVVAGRPD